MLRRCGMRGLPIPFTSAHYVKIVVQVSRIQLLSKDTHCAMKGLWSEIYQSCESGIPLEKVAIHLIPEV